MDVAKFAHYRSKIEKIRSGLIGGVEKTLKTNKEGSGPVADISDGAAQAYSRQMMQALGEQEWKKLQRVDEALKKIDSGNFGTCTECGEPIPEARLDVIPFTEFCVICLGEIEKGKELNNH